MEASPNGSYFQIKWTGYWICVQICFNDQSSHETPAKNTFVINKYICLSVTCFCDLDATITQKN